MTTTIPTLRSQPPYAAAPPSTAVPTSPAALLQVVDQLAQVAAAAAVVLRSRSDQAAGPLRAIAPEVTPAPMLDVASGAGDVQPRLAGATMPASAEPANAGVPASAPAAMPSPVDDRPAVPDAKPAAPEREPAAPGRPLAGITPDQNKDAPSLSKEEAAAACGPAAAVAFARATGKDVSLDEAAKVAREVGWDTSGMKGPDSQVQLLDRLGMKARKEGVDWEQVKRTVADGKPVIIDTPGHYWVVEGYDPDTGEFDFGRSGSVLAGANGRTKFRPEEMDALSGAARSAIYLD